MYRRGKSFLLCFLHITVVLLEQTCAVINNPRLCSASSCGKITNISYPFRLKDDPETCGDKRYELVCEKNRTVLYLFWGKYYVQAINYKNYTIRLVDPAIQEADFLSTPRYSLSASNFTGSYVYSYNEDPYQVPDPFWYVYVMYLNCSNPVKDDPRYVDTAPYLKWNSKGHIYAFAGNLRPRDLKVDCSAKMVAPTSLFNYTSYWAWRRQKKTFSYAEIYRMLVYGFDVSWITIACEDLSCDYRYCRFSQTTENLECTDDVCHTPFGFHVKCGKKEAHDLLLLKNVIHIKLLTSPSQSHLTEKIG
ncbi:Wall-associated receptor kinase, galacturonan-binding domain [Sesbania bispinosa]|nr:Wall-associated receptor kinase, galacturonan-binding domain [Sesbania bispinosa]